MPLTAISLELEDTNSKCNDYKKASVTSICVKRAFYYKPSSNFTYAQTFVLKNVDLKIAPFPKTQLMSSFVEIMKISNSQFGKVFLHKFLPVLRLSLKEITFKKLEKLNNECMDWGI